jgi:osmoprotectant transport system permease protein
VNEQLALLPHLFAAHLRLTLAALLAGTLLAVPAGVLVSRTRRLEGPLLALASSVQTVPALALLAVMVPLLAGLGLPGIGYLPAFLGLTLYCLLPILRNTVAGLRGIDPALLEAAQAVGLTAGQRLRLIELPLALPVLLAGLRTATVWTVGMATLSTPPPATPRAQTDSTYSTCGLGQPIGTGSALEASTRLNAPSVSNAPSGDV